MKKFIKNLGGCFPFRRHRKKNHRSSCKVFLPVQKEDVNQETATKNPLPNNLLTAMNKHNKKLIVDRSFTQLIEEIQSIITKQGFSVQSLASGLNGQDGLFRVLTTRLKAAETIQDPFFKEEIFPYLDKQLLTLDQKNDKDLIKVLIEQNIITADGIIKLRHLGDGKIYDIGLHNLDPQRITQLKENLLKALGTLHSLITSRISVKSPLSDQPEKPQASVTPPLSDQSAKPQTSIKPQDNSKSAFDLAQSQQQKSIKTPKTGFAFFNPGYGQDAGNTQEANGYLYSCITQKAC